MVAENEPLNDHVSSIHNGDKKNYLTRKYKIELIY